jgi:hypothetical protein
LAGEAKRGMAGMVKKSATPKTASASRKRGSVNAPGQLYGFSVQITRSVAHLLQAKEGESVSVEHLDDVATESADTAILEQDKSGLAHNPVADRSVELWKTLRNWVKAIRSGALKTNTKFVLYVAQDHHGGIIDNIHRVTTRADADAVVQSLRKQFWGSAPKFAKRSTLPAELAEHVNDVLNATDDVLAHLFTNLTLENGTGSPNDDLHSLIAAKAISEDKREQVLTHLLGWAKRTIDKLIEKKEPAVIPWEDFHKQLVGAAKKFDRSDAVLASTPAALSQAEIEKELRARTYVRQLQAVQCDESTLVRAVNDFLRSAVDRTRWSEQGDVLEGSFGEFEDQLERAWDSQRKRVNIEQKNAEEEDRGQLLYANCSGLQVRLQGMDVPSHFVPGSFHTLADSLRVGWHPRYREVLTPAEVATKRDRKTPPPGASRNRPGSTSPPIRATDVVDDGGGT